MSSLLSLPKANYHRWGLEQRSTEKLKASPFASAPSLPQQSSTMPELLYCWHCTNPPLNLTLHSTIIQELDKKQKAPEPHMPTRAAQGTTTQVFSKSTTHVEVMNPPLTPQGKELVHCFMARTARGSLCIWGSISQEPPFKHHDRRFSHREPSLSEQSLKDLLGSWWLFISVLQLNNHILLLAFWTLTLAFTFVLSAVIFTHSI